MAQSSLSTASSESDLKAFLADASPAAQPRLRALVTGWTSGGGQLQFGKASVRLLGNKGRAFTAGTLHRNHGDEPHLELCRPLLRANGLTDDAWDAWCDDRPELESLGFDSRASYPWVRLGSISDPNLVRLAEGLRDIARAVNNRSA